jgi:hypothetical protein
VLGLFFLVCAGYYAVPVWDSDFWWHIASGRAILQHGLPSADPFGVFAAVDSVRNDTVLKGQWLGQVVLYGLYAAGGVNAVVTFRVLVLLTGLGLLLWRCRRLAVGWWPTALLLALAAVSIGDFGGERPQLLSFLFACLFFFAVDRAEHDSRWLFALPLISLPWANSHGGVLLAVALLGLWVTLKLFDANSTGRDRRRWLLALAAVVLASLATPNGLQTYYYLFDLEGSVLQSRTSEYASVFQLYTLGQWWSQAWALLFYVVALVGCVGLYRQRAWRPLAVTLFLGLISASSVRYFIFFLLLASPYIALGLQALLEKKLPGAGSERRVPVMANVLLAVAMITVLLWGAWRGELFRGGFYAAAYPVAIADFMQRSLPPGAQGQQPPRVFNTLEWGGYLLWRLAPRVQLYIDGRMLDAARFPPYTHILWATPQGVQWFQRQGFQWVILPHHGRYDPQRYGLIDYLRRQADWRQVYGDDKGVVFRRISQ